jgi:chemotaxis protein methyltransferase CheR
MIHPADYDFLAQFFAERTGALLGPGKEFLLQVRLVPLAQSWGLGSLHDLVAELRKTATSPLGAAVLDLLATPETHFFREPDTFDDLHDRLLPALISARRSSRRLRIWSAATATGQEAYSLAIILREQFPDLADWQVELWGTDLSAPAIARAVAGRYTQTEVQLGLPIRQLLRYFQPANGAWQIGAELRRMVRFQVQDLREPFVQLGLFDVILCRNVLGWFGEDEQRAILERLSGSLQPDGCLLLGSAESAWATTALWDRLDDCRSVAYQPSTSAAVRTINLATA